MVSVVKKQRCRSNFSYYTLYLLHKIQWCRTTPLFKVWLRHRPKPIFFVVSRIGAPVCLR
ncbi:hypothetical protein Hanom_Chr16g01480121 [Helianthus anomalus]